MLRWKLCVEARGEDVNFPLMIGGTITNMAIKPNKNRANISKSIPLFIQILLPRVREPILYLVSFDPLYTLHSVFPLSGQDFLYRILESFGGGLSEK
jgi:hypothetical protein